MPPSRDNRRRLSTPLGSGPEVPAAAQVLLDLTIPLDDRVAILAAALRNPGEESMEALRFLVRNAERAHGPSLHLAKAKELTDTLIQLQYGPCRPGVFLGRARALPSRLTETGEGVPRALVSLDDGTRVFVAAPVPDHLNVLAAGTPVIVDAHATALLASGSLLAGAQEPTTGEIGILERRTGPHTVEVSIAGGQQRLDLLLAPSLLTEIEAGRVSPGASLAIHSRQLVAHHAVTDAKERWAHLKFLHRGPVPCVRVEDLACPHPVIDDVDRHVAIELERPEVHRRYAVGSSVFRLLTGPTGTGKSLAIRAIHHRLRERCARALGVDVDAAPPRAFFLRGDQLISKFLGDSEKAFSRALDEVLQLAAEPVKDARGQSRRLPVLLVLEEVEALGRVRGGDFDTPAMDRILGTVLQLLDPGRPEFRGVTVVCLATTNTPDLVDPAFARRIGARIEVFGRLNRTSFRAMLRKHVERLPVAAENGTPPAAIWSRHIENLAAWLWSPEATPLVELTLAGSTQPLPRFARDFLTPSLVHQAVEEAGREAVRNELEGTHPSGLTFDTLARALDSQVRNVVGAIREANAGLYCDLPQGARVASVRRLANMTRPPSDLLDTTE